MVKMKKAHKDVALHLECLCSRHSKKIGIANLLYLIFFEAFRCLFDIAPSKKEALTLMKDAMQEAKNIDKNIEPINRSVH
jgi:hypothetical protein